MILVQLKRMMDTNYFSKERLERETFRLINVVYSDSHGALVICERLHDDEPSFSEKNDKEALKRLPKKGDIVSHSIKDLRVINNTSEDEIERETYLKELRTLLK